MIAAEGQFASRFREALPEAVRTRVVATLDHNVGHDDLPAIAAILEPLLADAWLARTQQIVVTAHQRAHAGGAAALGPEETGRSPKAASPISCSTPITTSAPSPSGSPPRSAVLPNCSVGAPSRP